MHISNKKLVLYVTLLVASLTFILASECNAQRGLRLPRRQQQIENRVRQVSPQKPASDQKPTPAAEEKAEESPAPAVTEKAPAPAAEKKADETHAPAVKEKAKKSPSKKKADETPAPAVKEENEEKPNACISHIYI